MNETVNRVVAGVIVLLSVIVTCNSCDTKRHQKSLRCDFYLRKLGQHKFAVLYKKDSLLFDRINEIFWDECVIAASDGRKYKIFYKRESTLKVDSFQTYVEFEKFYRANISASKRPRLRLADGTYSMLGDELDY